MLKRISAVLIMFFMLFALLSEEDRHVTISIGAGGSKAEIESLREVAAMYVKRHPDVTLKIVDLPQSTSDRYSIYLQNFETKSGDLDIIQIDQVWVGDLAQHLLDLGNYGAKKVTSDMFAKMVENCTVDGRIVALPWFADAPALYYRKDLLDKYHHPVPQTWTDLAKTAYIIQEGERSSGNSDFVGYVWQGEAYEGLTCCALEWIYSNGGGTIVSNDKIVTLNNENAVKALDMAESWIGSISPDGVTSMNEEDSRAVFQSGKAAFMRNWQYAWSLCQEKDSKVKGKVGIVGMPAGSDGLSGNTAGVENIGVTKYSKHPEIAADVVLFIVSPEAQKYRALKSELCPTLKSLYEDAQIIEKEKHFAVYVNIYGNTINRPSTVTAPNYNYISKIFYKAVHSVLVNEKDTKTAISEASSAISKVTGFPEKKNGE